jgi:hypothetical protein
LEAHLREIDNQPVGIGQREGAHVDLTAEIEDNPRLAFVAADARGDHAWLIGLSAHRPTNGAGRRRFGRVLRPGWSARDKQDQASGDQTRHLSDHQRLSSGSLRD